MPNIDNILQKYESRLLDKTIVSVRSSINMCIRCWQAYRFSKDESEARVYLQKASHTAITAHRKNTADMEMYSLAIFIAIEAGHMDTANEMLDRAMSYRSYLKAESPFYYAMICFLYSYLEIKQNRIRSARKHWRQLSSVMENSLNPDYCVMQGLLHLAREEFNEAFFYFNQALKSGSNSLFLYEGLYRYYVKNTDGPVDSTLLRTLVYAAKRGAEIAPTAAKYRETLLSAAAIYPQEAKKLYAYSGFPDLLIEICTFFLESNDYSAHAYGYYLEAMRKQVMIPGLNKAILLSAYKNKTKSINHYPMEKFLSDPIDMDLSMSVYVYHLLLTDPNLSDLLPGVQSKILRTGSQCLETGLTTPEALSTIHFYWKRCMSLGITGAEVEKAEDIIRSNLTIFEVTRSVNSGVRFIYITEHEKRGMAVYEMPEDEDSIIIEAVSESPGFTCLGASRRTILDETLFIRRAIGSAGADLYKHFFDKGDRRFHTLAFLSGYYLDMEDTPDEARAVFQALLDCKGVSKTYKNQVLAALGFLHYNAFSFDEALLCYRQIDYESLSDNSITQILSVYTETKEYERAAKLLINKHTKVDLDVLIKSADVLIDKLDAPEVLAEIVYNLILNGVRYDKFLNFVLEYFNASYDELAHLSSVLEEDNYSSTECDEKILTMAVKIFRFDKPAQKAFVRLYKADANNPALTEFVELATYSMLITGTKPEYDTVDILERICLSSTGEDLLSWGLGSTYLKYNVKTFRSDEILRVATASLESNRISFGIFKEKNPLKSLFLEKYQPFEYRSSAGKDCKLYYNFDGGSHYYQEDMRYLCYGCYIALIPLFYEETIHYYFSEELATGSVTTSKASLKKTNPFMLEKTDNNFFAINNGIIYEQIFKHDQVESIISSLISEVKPVRSKLM